MHELSLCRSLLRIIEEKSVELNHSAERRVTAISLEMGVLCGVDIRTLQFYFPLIAKNSVAADAVLQISVVPAEAECLACRECVIIEFEYLGPCPACGAYRLIFKQEGGLIIKSMEVS